MTGDVERIQGGAITLSLSKRGGRSMLYWVCWSEGKEGGRGQGKKGSWEEKACGGEEEEEKMDGVSLAIPG